MRDDADPSARSQAAGAAEAKGGAADDHEGDEVPDVDESPAGSFIFCRPKRITAKVVPGLVFCNQWSIVHIGCVSSGARQHEQPDDDADDGGDAGADAADDLEAAEALDGVASLSGDESSGQFLLHIPVTERFKLFFKYNYNKKRSGAN